MASAAVGHVSPATSPRLPSPPPFPEVQLPPKSPGMPSASLSESSESSNPDNQPLRRIRPGTKAADMASGPPLIPLSELDSPFQLQEHLKSLHTHHTRSPTSPTATQPITSTTALEIATPPPAIDRSLWLYELTRFLVLRANDLIVSFFRETPPCSATTCPEMRASEWQYLCAVHEPPKPCCAIDYSCHTLDWAAYILTSQKHFPSRLTLGPNEAGGGGGAQQGVRQLTNIMRRVYRIFAHAWFQHRGVFWDVEGREGLYVLFKTVCDVYGLMPDDTYTIPREAEGVQEGGDEQRAPRARSPEKKLRGTESRGDDDTVNVAAATGPGATQRRHKATPSVGSAVTTIQESDEDDKGEGSSPVKEKQGGLVDKMAKTGLGETPGASLAETEKTAENKDGKSVGDSGEVPTVRIEGGDGLDVKKIKAEGRQTEGLLEGNVREQGGMVGGSISSAETDATTVKVEEKVGEDD